MLRVPNVPGVVFGRSWRRPLGDLDLLVAARSHLHAGSWAPPTLLGQVPGAFGLELAVKDALQEINRAGADQRRGCIDRYGWLAGRD